MTPSKIIFVEKERGRTTSNEGTLTMDGGQLQAEKDTNEVGNIRLPRSAPLFLPGHVNAARKSLDCQMSGNRLSEPHDS
jgi:hypothetical protein